MLSDKLKSKSLFKITIEEVEQTTIGEALDMLEECVDNLILGMKTVESLGIMPSEDIEEYVLSCMELYEKRYYSLDEDEFDKFVRDYLKRG